MGSSFDAPQTGPVLPPLNQTAEGYERQQAMSWPANTSFAAPRLGQNFFPQGSPYDQVGPNRDFRPQLRSLQRHYTILDRNHLVIDLLGEEPALYALLIEAVRPLQTAFGEGRIIQLRVLVSDDDSFISVTVQLPAGFGGDPERALRSFDADWWLNNCHRSGGTMVFDYEIQDVV